MDLELSRYASLACYNERTFSLNGGQSTSYLLKLFRNHGQRKTGLISRDKTDVGRGGCLEVAPPNKIICRHTQGY